MLTQASLKLLASSNPPVSASWIAGIIGMSHRAWSNPSLLHPLLKNDLQKHKIHMTAGPALHEWAMWPEAQGRPLRELVTVSEMGPKWDIEKKTTNILGSELISAAVD